MNLLLSIFILFGMNFIKFENSALIFKGKTLEVHTRNIIFSPGLKYAAFVKDKNLLIYSEKGRVVKKIRLSGEDWPDLIIDDRGDITLFYPASYRLIAYDGKGKLRLEYVPPGHRFYYESYSDFDRDGYTIAIVFKKNSHAYLVVFENYREKFRETFKNFLPARVWVKDGYIFVRLYRVKNGHVTNDFVMMFDLNGKLLKRFKIPRVNFVERSGDLTVLATKKKIFLIKGDEKRTYGFKKLIYDVGIKGSRVFVLLGQPERTLVRNPEVYEITGNSDKVLSFKGLYLFPHFYRTNGKLFSMTEKGDSHEL